MSDSTIKLVDILKKFIEKSKPNKSEQIVFSIDISGSTGDNFKRGLKILDKELECATEYILDNLDNKYQMFGFDVSCTPIFKITPNFQEQFVELPNYRPGSSTHTHLAFREINKITNIPDRVILLTDGQTNSSPIEIQTEIKKIIEKKIKLDIIAVSTSSTDLNTISISEQMRIPGMDLLRPEYIGNYASSLTIYNKFHSNIPFIGAVTSKLDKKNIMFMNIPIIKPIPEFLNDLIEVFKSNEIPINWGSRDIDFKKMVSEIGKLLSIFFVSFPENHPFIKNICDNMYTFCENMTSERVLNLIKYGFISTKEQQPMIFTNVDQHVKEKVVKKQQFTDAVSQLKTIGTTGGFSNVISIPKNGVIVISNDNAIEIDNNIGDYPKSADRFGNIYFTTDLEYAQATRIGLRRLCKTVGFRNAEGSPSVIFYIANQMFLMFLTGHSMNSVYIRELQKLAQIQTSLEVLVRLDTYSGKGLYQMWKESMMPQIHFSKPETHTTLYVDSMINPLGLTEPIWWACMMSMLGIFNEQLPVYNQVIDALGIDQNVDTFLNYMKTNFSSKVIGNVQCVTISPKPTSVFTLEPFNDGDSIFMLNDHGQCTTKTCYSLSEKDYVKGRGCVWCRYRPIDSDFCPIISEDPVLSIEKAIQTATNLSVIGSSASSNASSTETVFTSTLEFALESMTLQDTRLIRVNLIGITGAGKSTYTHKLKEALESNGIFSLIISSDKWRKDGKDDKSNIKREIHEFESNPAKVKVAIVDLCNDQGIKSILFDHDFYKYESFDIYPNMNKSQFSDYEHWCLRNVIMRPIHSSNTNYWLNPVSVGLETCIKVHNMKTKNIKQLIRNTTKRSDLNIKSSLTDIRRIIDPGADRYAEYLASKSMDDDISQLIADMKIC